MTDSQPRRVSGSTLFCLAVVVGIIVLVLAALKVSWLAYAAIAICSAVIVAGSYLQKFRMQLCGWLVLVVVAFVAICIDFVQWQNSPQQQAIVAAQEERQRQEKALAPAKQAQIVKIKADLAADGVRIGPSTSFKVAYANGLLVVEDNLNQAQIELKVMSQGREEASVFPLRQVDGFWRLGCEFVTLVQGRAEKVWLGWQESLPVTGSTTLLYQFVVDNGRCPVGFGPIKHPAG